MRDVPRHVANLRPQFTRRSSANAGARRTKASSPLYRIRLAQHTCLKRDQGYDLDLAQIKGHVILGQG
jgi:hypothetical protein